MKENERKSIAAPEKCVDRKRTLILYLNTKTVSWKCN